MEFPVYNMSLSQQHACSFLSVCVWWVCANCDVPWVLGSFSSLILIDLVIGRCYHILCIINRQDEPLLKLLIQQFDPHYDFLFWEKHPGHII